MLLMALAALIENQTATTPLVPSGKWQLQAENNYCLLSRNFGAANDTVFAIEPVFDTDLIEIVVITPSAAPLDQVGEGQIFFDADSPLTASYWSTTTKDARRRVTRLIAPKTALERFAKASSVGIKTAQSDVFFRTTGSAGASASLDQCQSELAQTWKSAPGTVARRVALAGSVAQFFGPNVYPEAARDAHEEGRVEATLLTAPDGLVKDCRIIKTESVILGQTTCAIILARFKFLPARSMDGRLLWSTYRFAIRWQLP